MVQRAQPLTGSTVTVGDKTTHLIISSATMLPALTIVFPTPYVSRSLKIASRYAITLMTLSAPGYSIYGTLGSLTLNRFAEFLYIQEDSAWYRIG